MPLQEINLGIYANDGTGDDLRTAFEKVKTNFTDIYNSLNGANVASEPPTVDVDQGELWWNTLDGRLYIKYSTAWIDASPKDPVIHYDISAETVSGGANVQLNGTDASIDAIKIASSTNITVTRTNANTITLSSTSYTGNVTGNLTGNVTGNVTGNAGTVTNGVYINEGYSDPNWITSLAGSKISGNISGRAGSVVNGVYTNISYANPTWIASLGGGKITGNINGNAGTVTNGVYTTSSINELADVDTATAPPTDGQALVWYSASSKWGPGKPYNPIALDSLTDVDTVSIAPTNGQALVWYSAYSKWGPGNVVGGGGSGTLDFGTFTAPAGFTLDLGTF
jgi:hypothetical protein